MSKESFDKSEFAAQTQELLANSHLNKMLMDSLPYPAMLIRKDRRVVAINKVAQEIGVKVGTFCWDTFGQQASITDEDKEYYAKNQSVPANGIKCIFCKANQALASQEPVNEKIPAGDITYDTYWVPLTDDVYFHYAIVL